MDDKRFNEERATVGPPLTGDVLFAFHPNARLGARKQMNKAIEVLLATASPLWLVQDEKTRWWLLTRKRPTRSYEFLARYETTETGWTSVIEGAS